MNSRVKEIRKAKGLTQTEFGARLGVTGTAITKIEKGSNILTDQMEKAILREFGVAPLWFHTGEGEMFTNNEKEVDRLIDVLMAGESEFARATIKALAKLGGDEWKSFEKLVTLIANELRC